MTINGTITAGQRAPVQDRVETFLDADEFSAAVLQRLGRSPNELCAFTVRDSSMTGIVENGERLVIEPCTDFGPDGLYVVSRDGLTRVKRLRLRLADGLLSVESGAGRAPELLPLSCVGRSFSIHGLVVGVVGFRNI